MLQCALTLTPNRASDNANEVGASTAITAMQTTTNKMVTTSAFTPTNDVSNVPLTKKTTTLAVKAVTPEWITPALMQ